MIRRRLGKSLAFALCFVAGGFGCRTNRPAGERPLHDPSTDIPQDAPSGVDVATIVPGGADRVVDLSFDVLRADLPAGAWSASRKIWNHVDEMRMDSAVVARMARNGFRVGAVPPGSWPAIQAVLEASGARTYRSVMAPPRGAPLLITLGRVSDPESIFTYNAQDRLTGRTFTAGDKLIVLDYVFQPQLGSYTELQAGFEVRHDKGVMTWSREGGVIRQVPDIDLHVFKDLVVNLTLEGGESFLIGPSQAATNEYLIGGRYLTIDHDGEKYVSMLFITPAPYQTEGAKAQH